MYCDNKFLTVFQDILFRKIEAGMPPEKLEQLRLRPYVQSCSQSEMEAVLLVASPTGAFTIWPYVHAKSDRFLSILD